jgi:preprotein translocase subunit SecD
MLPAPAITGSRLQVCRKLSRGEQGSGNFTPCALHPFICSCCLCLPYRLVPQVPRPTGTLFIATVDSHHFEGQPQARETLAKCERVLSTRLRSFGLAAFIEPTNDCLRCIVGSQESNTLAVVQNLLTKRGWLELRLVHPDSERLAKDNRIAEGYEQIKLVHKLPGGRTSNETLFVQKTAEPGVDSGRIKSAAVLRGSQGYPEIGFTLDSSGAAAFARMTRENISRRLAIVFDGEVYSAPVIRSEIPSGAGAISGSFSEAEAHELATLLENPLPVQMRVLEQRKF